MVSSVRLTKDKMTVKGNWEGVMFVMRHSAQRGRQIVLSNAQNSTIVGISDSPTFLDKVRFLKRIWKML